MIMKFWVKEWFNWTPLTPSESAPALAPLLPTEHPAKTDQSVLMCMLIWIFSVCTCNIAGYGVPQLICHFQTLYWLFTLSFNRNLGPVVQNVVKLLANMTLKFLHMYIEIWRIHWYFLLQMLLTFWRKNINVYENTLATTVNKFVIIKLVKQTMLQTPGSRFQIPVYNSRQEYCHILETIFALLSSELIYITDFPQFCKENFVTSLLLSIMAY